MMSYYELLPIFGVSAMGLIALMICVYDACFQKDQARDKSTK